MSRGTSGMRFEYDLGSNTFSLISHWKKSVSIGFRICNTYHNNSAVYPTQQGVNLTRPQYKILEKASKKISAMLANGDGNFFEVNLMYGTKAVVEIGPPKSLILKNAKKQEIALSEYQFQNWMALRKEIMDGIKTINEYLESEEENAEGRLQKKRQVASETQDLAESPDLPETSTTADTSAAISTSPATKKRKSDGDNDEGELFQFSQTLDYDDEDLKNFLLKL